MILNIAALLLVLGITLIQSIFGFFSGLINTVCTLTAAATAFGFYEPLNNWVTKDFEMHPAYSEPICFGLLFVLTLFALRTLSDLFVRGNVKVPMYVDWGGGAVLGFINALICVGVMVIFFRMMPFGDRVMMFSAYERTDQVENGRVVFRRNSVWFKPDEFTVGLINMLSNGSLKGTTAFSTVYPDFVEWLAQTGNTIQEESTPSPFRDAKGGDGFKDGIKVEQWWEQKEPLQARYIKDQPSKDEPKPQVSQQTYTPASGMKLIGTRLKLNRASADRDKGSAVHRFRPTMIRLVGYKGQGEDRTSEEAPARILGGVDARLSGANRIVDIDNNFSLGEADATIDAYFEVDQDFKPAFVEYRRHARAAVAPEPAKRGPGGEIKIQSQEERRQQEQIGQTGFMGIVIQPSGDTDDLPFAMAVNKVQAEPDATLSDGRFASGRIFGDRAKFDSGGTGQEVTKFKIPAGERILQVRFKPKQALSLPGQVINYAARTLNQYTAVDRDSNDYRLAGYFAIVKRGGQDYVEIFFTGEDDALKSSYRNMLDFKEIKPTELSGQDDAVIGLLFVVKPNKTITSIKNQTNAGITGLNFSTGGP